eukprot:gene14636-17291_t
MIRGAQYFQLKTRHKSSFTRERWLVFGQSKRIDLSVDIQQWQTLASLVQHFLKMLLSFFASADSCVAENLAQRLMRDPETSLEAFFFFFFFFFFYGFQLKIENVHSEVCNLFIDALIKDPD